MVDADCDIHAINYVLSCFGAVIFAYWSAALFAGTTSVIFPSVRVKAPQVLPSTKHKYIHPRTLALGTLAVCCEVAWNKWGTWRYLLWQWIAWVDRCLLVASGWNGVVVEKGNYKQGIARAFVRVCVCVCVVCVWDYPCKSRLVVVVHWRAMIFCKVLCLALIRVLWIVWHV